MKTIPEFISAKGKKIVMSTAYDAWSARLVAESVDAILVGDSAAMVVHGMDSTLPATVEIMELHVAAVARSISKTLIIGDMPFLSFRKSRESTLEAAGKLIRAGAHAVKLEGLRGHEAMIEALVGSGIPVMGHLGLTPQFSHAFGGFKVQAQSPEAQDLLFHDALSLEKLGCFSVVLECIPKTLAKKVTESLSIPTIGIGAGPDCDGQILVLHDLLGLNPAFKPKFLRRYLNGFELMSGAVEAYARDVRENRFPSEKESYE